MLPFLGGIYMRYVPSPLARRFLDSMEASAVAWSYLHPYDLDTDEPFFVLPHANWLTSRIVHSRRGATLHRLETLIAAAGGPAQPLGEIARELRSHDLPRLHAA